MPARFPAEHDVLRDSKGGNEHKMLVNHADALGDHVFGVEVLHALAANIDVAGGRGLDAVQNIHQRGFTGAVFTDQGENLAAPDLQTDVVIRQNAGELHGNMVKLNDWFFHGSLCF